MIVEGDLWRMWHLSCTGWEVKGVDRPRHKYHIRYAESRDGVRWDKKGGPSIDFADSSEYAISQPSVVKVNGGGYRIGYGTASSGRCVADSLALLGCHRGGERSGIVFRCSPGTAGRRLHGRGGLHAQGCRLSFSVRRSVDISGLGRSAFSEGECVTKVPIRKAIGTDFTASAFLPRNPANLPGFNPCTQIPRTFAPDVALLSHPVEPGSVTARFGHCLTSRVIHAAMCRRLRNRNQIAGLSSDDPRVGGSAQADLWSVNLSRLSTLVRVAGEIHPI